MSMVTRALPMLGLYEVSRSPVRDGRGWFERLFCVDALREVGWTQPVAQVNRSCTRLPGTVRGMHFQKFPHAEKKLITCLRGAVWDVVVDVRTDSATFLQSFGRELVAEDESALLVPEGFAHGFQALTPDAELLYVHSVSYHRESEGGLLATDPALAIAWPLPVVGQSERDRSFAPLDASFAGVPP